MGKTMKRLISVLLSISIIMSTLSMVVLAEDAGLPPKFEIAVSSVLDDGSVTKVLGTVDTDYNAMLTIPNAAVNAGNVTLTVTMNDVDSLGVAETKSHSVTIGTGVQAQGNLFDTLNGFGYNGLRDFEGADIRANINGAVVTYTLAGTWNGETGKIITGTPDSVDTARTAWHTMVNDENFVIEEQAADNSYVTIANGSWLQIGNEALVFEKEGDLTVDPSAADGNLIGNIQAAVRVIETEDAALAFVLKKGTALAVGGSVATLAQDVAVTIDVPADGLTVLSGLRDAVAEFDAAAMIKSLLGWMDAAVKLIDNAPGEVAVNIDFGTFDKQPAEKGEPPVVAPYDLRKSIAGKLENAKFVGVIASTNLDGNTTEVVGTVDGDYNAKLHIPNANVNANSLWLGVGMKDVASLGGGQRIHALPEKHLMGDSAQGACLNIFNTLNGAGFTALKEFNHATVNAAIIPVSGETAAVTYTLNGAWKDEDGKTITGTPNSAEAARAAWHTMVNEDNFATPANNGDSQIVIKSGSWLQIGNQRLQFAEGKDDIVLFTENGDTVETICDKVELADGEAGMTLAFLLKEGTTLAVGDSSAVLKNDVLVKATGIDESNLMIDGKNALVALQEAVHSEGADMVTLLVQLAGVMNTAVAAVDGSTVDVEMRFLCNHTLTATEAKAATCTEDGNSAYWTCEVCGKIYSDEAATKEIALADTVVKALEHKGKAQVQENVVEATCIATGSYDAVVYCERCNEELSRETVTVGMKAHALKHHEAKVATCTEIGWDAYDTCANCDYTTYKEIQALGHDYVFGSWGAWTETDDGYTIAVNLVCRREGCAEDCDGHTKVVTDGVEIVTEEGTATCTQAGTVTYTAAITIGEEEHKAEPKTVTVGEPLGHSYDEGEITTPATCTEAGVKTFTCMRCKHSYTEAIAAIGHNLTATAAKAATCTEDGNIAYWTCGACNKIYSDAAATTEITLADTVVAKLGHDLVHHAAKAATCTEAGWSAYDTCTRCDYTTYSAIAALGHDVEQHEAKAATCTEAGWSAYDTCSRCDYTTYSAIAALGHNVVSHEAKAATCTEAGWNAYETCSRCDHSTYSAIAALGHDVERHEAKAATCTEAGWNAYDTCTRCDHSTYSEIAATGHKLTATAAKAATCTEGGNIAYWTCEACSKIYSDEAATVEITEENIGISATGHAYGEPVWAEDHTTVTRTCAQCEDVQTATAEITSEVTTEATYTSAGVRTYTATATFAGETEATAATWTEEIPQRRRSGGGGGSSRIDRPGNTITVTDPVDNPPEVEIPEVKPPLSDLPVFDTFTDVADDAWYADAVKFVSGNRLMIGVDNAETFAPTLNTTRSMIAMILYRMEGEPSVADMNVTFPDVAASDWYHDAAVWALSNDVFIGYDDGSFRGAEVITREQLAAVFYRYAQNKGLDLGDAAADLSKYADKSQIGAWAVSALQWAVSTGLFEGRSETTIVPQGSTQRAELATVLFRFDKAYNVISEGTDIH